MSIFPQVCISNIRVANKNDNVFKEESVLSFDNPESKDGLYVCMRSFYSVGKRNLALFSALYKSNLFLNIKRTRTKCLDTDASKDVVNVDATPKRLAIGIPGGFKTEGDLFDTQEQYSVVYFDGHVEHSIPLTDLQGLPQIVIDSAHSIMKSESCLIAIAAADTGNIGWTGDIRKESRYAVDLMQINNGVKIPPSGWKCERCELTTNLWLNLTDGSILCGRINFDGTGGNNHACDHYKATGYPLAVKLGTIGADSVADVYSYPEDDMVSDKHLTKHLAFFGIYAGKMEKTEKSLVEMEIDLNRQLDEKWASSRILETDNALSFVAGKGLTPIQNIGSSCYMNVVLQVIFSTPRFRMRYFEAYNDILRDPNNSGLTATSPIDNVEIQLAKMADGLLSGLYSSMPKQFKQHIRPYMLKHALCRSHPDFSSNRQQDAAEFFL